MDCHVCPHRQAIVAGKFKHTPFERTPCASCFPDAVSSYAHEFNEGMSAAAGVLADSPGVPDEAFPEELPAETDPEPAVSMASMFPVGVFLNTLISVLALPDTDLAILRLRYRGLSRLQVAARLGMTPKAVSTRNERIFQRWPCLLAVFPDRWQAGADNYVEKGD